jgi:hypothetical protein
MDIITLGNQTEWQTNGLEWMRYDYPLTKNDLVLDIGSYRGEFSDEIQRRYGCRVEKFEALDNRAAWTYEGLVKMGGQFLYTSIYNDGGKEYGCEDINEYLNQEVALCKINIEGAEYELLNYMNIKNIKYLQVQFHLIDGYNCESLYEQVVKKLSKTHKLSWRYPFVWESWERC